MLVQNLFSKTGIEFLYMFYIIYFIFIYFNIYMYCIPQCDNGSLNAFIWPRVKIYSTEMLLCEFGAILGLKIDDRWFLLVCGFWYPRWWAVGGVGAEKGILGRIFLIGLCPFKIWVGGFWRHFGNGYKAGKGCGLGDMWMANVDNSERDRFLLVV